MLNSPMRGPLTNSSWHFSEFHASAYLRWHLGIKNFHRRVLGPLEAQEAVSQGAKNNTPTTSAASRVPLLATNPTPPMSDHVPENESILLAVGPQVVAAHRNRGPVLHA